MEPNETHQMTKQHDVHVKCRLQKHKKNKTKHKQTHEYTELQQNNNTFEYLDAIWWDLFIQCILMWKPAYRQFAQTKMLCFM